MAESSGYQRLQRVPEGTDRTEGMVRMSGNNQLRPQNLKFEVKKDVSSFNGD